MKLTEWIRDGNIDDESNYAEKGAAMVLGERYYKFLEGEPYTSRNCVATIVEQIDYQNCKTYSGSIKKMFPISFINIKDYYYDDDLEVLKLVMDIKLSELDYEVECIGL